MGNDVGIAEKQHQRLSDIHEFWLAGDIAIGEAVNARCLGGDIAFRVNQAVKYLARWQQVE